MSNERYEHTIDLRPGDLSFLVRQGFRVTVPFGPSIVPTISWSGRPPELVRALLTRRCEDHSDGAGI